MRGCKTIAEYAIRKWMENNGFVAEFFTVEMHGYNATIIDRTGDSMKIRYDPKTKSVEMEEKFND